MDNPNSINIPSLVNILTLRYDPTQTSILPKYNSNNFSTSTDVPQLEKIETLIIEDLKNKITSDVDSISIALSGGVDSTVVACLINKAVGEKCFAVLIDHGLLRKNEAKDCVKALKEGLGINIHHYEIGRAHV